MKKITQVFLFVLVTTLILTGCSRKDKDNAQSDVKWTIGLSQSELGAPWQVQVKADVKKAAAAHPEIKVIYKNAQNDTLRQQTQTEELISAGVDVIIILPKEAVPLTPVVTRAYQKGIPVIVLDRRIISDQYTCFIGADNKKIGKAAGKWIVEFLGGKGRVVELKGLMTSTTAQERHAGFRDGIKGSDIEIIFEADMKWAKSQARKEMESALIRFNDIDLVYCHYDSGTHGAYLAALDVGRETDIAFVGIDGLPQEGQAYVKQGIMAASFEYPTGGKEAIEIALDILNGKEVPKEITPTSRVFTKETIDAGGKLLPQQ